MLSAYVYGSPMRNKDKQKAKYVGINLDLTQHHEDIEFEKMMDANVNRQKHNTEKNNRSHFDPARYYHQIKEHKANKNVAAHSRNLLQLDAAKGTGYARFAKSKSGKKDHITAIDWHTYSGTEPDSP